jgi:hypothetical protein
MGNIKYILSRLSKMDYKAMINKVNTVHKKTNKNRISIFFDMTKCAKRYGAGYMDYDLFEMYNLTDEQRDTYITRGRNNSLISKYNDKAYFHIFENKDEFNEKFDKYIKRDWVKVKGTDKEKVLDFIDKHNTFMAKPIDGGCGKGIEKINVSDYNSNEELYNYLNTSNSNFELEEVIKQNEEVSKIYPGAINTVRVVTILKDNIPHVICAYFRIGNGKFVDNFNSGGMVAPIDVETGIVQDRAIDKNKILYENHPATGTPIKGFKFPYWNEALEMCKEAAKVVPQMAYVGWDVGFTPEGPLFVEANEFPGHDIYQLPEHTPNKIGMMPKFINI